VKLLRNRHEIPKSAQIQLRRARHIRPPLHASIVTRARAQQLPRYRARLKRLKVNQLTRMPPFEARAEVGGAEMIYSLTYRFDSNSAALAAEIARISGELQALPRP